jgi:apolipoprotein N-acyltransferase
MNLKNAVENHFTAKPKRAQRTYDKIKLHPFGESIDPLYFDSNLCFSWRLCALAVEV